MHEISSFTLGISGAVWNTSKFPHLLVVAELQTLDAALVEVVEVGHCLLHACCSHGPFLPRVGSHAHQVVLVEVGTTPIPRETHGEQQTRQYEKKRVQHRGRWFGGEKEFDCLPALCSFVSRTSAPPRVMLNQHFSRNFEQHVLFAQLDLCNQEVKKPEVKRTRETWHSRWRKE